MKHVTAMILAGVMIAAAIAIVAIDFGDPVRSYDIEYNLDGGVNGDNPSTYTRSDEFTFKPATREGHVFSGWYSDSDLTREILGVSKGTRGDLKIYAAWTTDLVGKGYSMNLSGTHKDGGDVPMSGTYEFRFLAKEGEDYFEELATDVSYGVLGYSDDVFYWSSDEAKLWTPAGQEILKTKDGDVLCDVTTYGDKTRWKSGFVVYKETCESNGMDYVCVLASVFEFEADPTYNVTASASDGISAYVGPGDYATGSDVTVKAVASEGYKLNGWYSGDKLVSKSADYRIHGLHCDVSLRAVAVKDDAAHWKVGEEANLSDGTGKKNTIWTVTEKYGGELVVMLEGENPVYMFIEPGRYIVHNSTTGNSRDAVVDGDVSRTIEWSLKYQGRGDAAPIRYSFAIDWTSSYSDYSMYREMDGARNHTSEDVDARFITWMDGDIARLAAILEQEVAEVAPDRIDDTVWMSNYLLAFVQYAVEYEVDIDSHHKDEYWKYPMETFFEGKGDCEDSVLLFVALAEHFHLNSAMILYLPSTGSGHAFSGIEVDADGKYFEIDGKRLFYCESTGHGYHVGKLPIGGEKYSADFASYPYRD